MKLFNPDSLYTLRKLSVPFFCILYEPLSITIYHFFNDVFKGVYPFRFTDIINLRKRYG